MELADEGTDGTRPPPGGNNRPPLRSEPFYKCATDKARCTSDYSMFEHREFTVVYWRGKVRRESWHRILEMLYTIGLGVTRWFPIYKRIEALSTWLLAVPVPAKVCGAIPIAAL